MVATTMPRFPGSQSRAVMEEKEQVAIQLLAQGLTVSQISPQLKCSQAFVRRVRDQLRIREGDTPERGQPTRWDGVELRCPTATSSSAPEQEKTT